MNRPRQLANPEEKVKQVEEEPKSPAMSFCDKAHLFNQRTSVCTPGGKSAPPPGVCANSLQATGSTPRLGRRTVESGTINATESR